MNRYLFLVILGLMASITLFTLALGGSHVVLFNPAGYIAKREVALMVLALRLMLIVVIPVFVLTFAIAWHYRAGNASARYLPNWEHNRLEEAIWWLVPCVIIVALASITWTSSHALDSYRDIATSTPPVEIEVVSLAWKWLFIYPQQGIATVNTLTIPVGTPISFKLTSDAPMNALWIPQLSGQEMMMPGMVTELHLEADAPGNYHGLSANYSGDGFAGMQFTAHAVSKSDFDAWVAGVRAATSTLDRQTYAALAVPSQNVPPRTYARADPSLYTWIVMKYMAPDATSSSMRSASNGSAIGAMSGMTAR